MTSIYYYNVVAISVHNTWTSILAIARRQVSVTFRPYDGLGPYITNGNNVTFIVSKCAPVLFNVILAYTVHYYRVICNLAGTSIYIFDYLAFESLIGSFGDESSLRKFSEYSHH